MADETNDGVKIYPPDTTLKAKLGNTSLDQVLSPQVVQAAQGAIEKSSEQFWTESMAGMDRIEKAFTRLQKDSAPSVVTEITEAVFAVKVSSGLGGYDLVSALAASLLGHCERLETEKLSDKGRQILAWHIQSMRRLLDARIKGDGGKAGEGILAELAKLPT